MTDSMGHDPAHHTPAPAVTADVLARLRDAQVVDADGATIGDIGQIYVSDADGTPTWVTVRTGHAAGRETFVPVHGHDLSQTPIRVPYSADVIAGAPSIEPDRHVSEEEERTLHAYYRGHGWAGDHSGRFDEADPTAAADNENQGHGVPVDETQHQHHEMRHPDGDAVRANDANDANEQDGDERAGFAATQRDQAPFVPVPAAHHGEDATMPEHGIDRVDDGRRNDVASDDIARHDEHAHEATPLGVMSERTGVVVGTADAHGGPHEHDARADHAMQNQDDVREAPGRHEEETSQVTRETLPPLAGRHEQITVDTTHAMGGHADDTLTGGEHFPALRHEETDADRAARTDADGGARLHRGTAADRHPDGLASDDATVSTTGMPESDATHRDAMDHDATGDTTGERSGSGIGHLESTQSDGPRHLTSDDDGSRDLPAPVVTEGHDGVTYMDGIPVIDVTDDAALGLDESGADVAASRDDELAHEGHPSSESTHGHDGAGRSAAAGLGAAGLGAAMRSERGDAGALDHDGGQGRHGQQTHRATEDGELAAGARHADIDDQRTSGHVAAHDGDHAGLVDARSALDRPAVVSTGGTTSTGETNQSHHEHALTHHEAADLQQDEAHEPEVAQHQPHEGHLSHPSDDRREPSPASAAHGQQHESGHRRVSDADEIRDGGYGWGSAAPIHDGAQPLGHPVRAWQDTMSFREGESIFVEREPDVWFVDAVAAEHAGFHQAEHWA